MIYRSSKTIRKGSDSRSVTINRRSKLENDILNACIVFTIFSEASPNDNFLSIPPIKKDGRRLNIIGKSLADAIKITATKMTPPLDPNHYSTSSFKRGGISWMIMADIPQSVVNAASGHSDKGASHSSSLLDYGMVAHISKSSPSSYASAPLTIMEKFINN